MASAKACSGVMMSSDLSDLCAVALFEPSADQRDRGTNSAFRSVGSWPVRTTSGAAVAIPLAGKSAGTGRASEGTSKPTGGGNGADCIINASYRCSHLPWLNVTAPTVRPFRPYAATKRRSLTDPCVKTISSPNEGTPTDLILTPNCPDQLVGTIRWARRSSSSLTMLCAATAAPSTALSQCSIDRNWYPNSTCGERATSPATKMSSVTTPWTSNARQPASQPRPQYPAASRAPSSH